MMKNMLRVLIGAMVAGIGVESQAAKGQPDKLYAGVAKVDITPAEKDAVNLSSQKLKMNGDRLFARVLVLKRGDLSLAIVALDQILFASEKVVAEAKKKWGLDHVVLCGSHTHAAMAPKGLRVTRKDDWTRKGKDPGKVLDWNKLSDDPWFAETEDKIVAAIGEAAEKVFPARIAAGTTTFENAYMAHNRRFVNENGGVTMMWANPKRIPTEPIDPTLRVIRIDDESGKQRVILVHYACHPVMMMRSGILSRDFPGVTVDHVEKKLGDDCMAMFLQGAAGDLDPYDLNEMGKHRDNLVRHAGESLGEAAVNLAKKLRPDEPKAMSVKQSVVSIPNRQDPKDISEVLMTTAVIGDDLAFTSIPGEPFVQHQLNLAKRSPIDNTLMIGLAYSGRGSPFLIYVPTEKAVKEGGYGATQCSFVAANAGKKMVDEAVSTIRRLAKGAE